jgi:hypothetical protein
MNTITYSENKNRIKRNYLIIFTCVNSVVIGIAFLITMKAEVNVTKLIIFVCLMLLCANIRLTFSYFKEIRSLDSMKTYYGLDKSDRKKLILAILLLLVCTMLGGFLLFLKGMVWVGIGILIVSAYTYLFFHKKLLKKSRGNYST